MLADRLVKMLLGAIAVLLAALFLQVTLKSPASADAAYSSSDSPKVYAVRLIGRIDLPRVHSVTALGNSDRTGLHFAAMTKSGIYVYRCDYFPQ